MVPQVKLSLLVSLFPLVQIQVWLALRQGGSWLFRPFSLDNVFHISYTRVHLRSFRLLLCLLSSLFARTAEISLQRLLLLSTVFWRIFRCGILIIHLVPTLLLPNLLLGESFGCCWRFQVVLILSGVAIQSSIDLFSDVQTGIQIAWLHVGVILWI